MVIVFPMLVSQSVSENVIPGIAKTVEGYLIVNHMSAIMDNPEVKRRGPFKGFRTTRKGWFAREGVEILDEISDEDREELVGSGGTKDKIDAEIDQTERDRKELLKRMDTIEKQMKDTKERLQKDEYRKELERLTKQRDSLEKRNREARKEKREEAKRKEEELKQKETRATAKITSSDYKSITLEPSYITVETTLSSGATRRELVGVKVIPYRVKSSVKLSRLILHDTQLGKLNAMMVGLGRKTTKWVWSLLDRWSGRLKIGGTTMTGDPRRDIIMARTGKEGLGIIVLDRNEDIDERFLNNMPKVNRLFKMGWGNIIVADDVTRNAYFCMRKFGGVCQAMNYAMMYQNLGQLKVYESMEDAKRQNSSLFKVSTRASKVFSEWKIEDKLLKYNTSEDK